MKNGTDEKHVSAEGSGELAFYFCGPPFHLVSRMSEIEALKFIGLAPKEPAGKQVSHGRCESGDRNGKTLFQGAAAAAAASGQIFFLPVFTLHICCLLPGMWL